MKYIVYAIATASWVLGEYEADSEKAALKMSDDDATSDWYKSLCHQCAESIELGDVYKTEVEAID